MAIIRYLKLFLVSVLQYGLSSDILMNIWLFTIFVSKSYSQLITQKELSSSYKIMCNLNRILHSNGNY